MPVSALFYVSPIGDNSWSGRLADPNAERTDGPFATIGRARDVLCALKETGTLHDATVYLRGGRYMLDEPLVFGPQHSGPVTYVAFPGETPVVDGGRRIKGWRLEQHGAGPCWVADVPEAAAGTWYFRQLWVNGERRRRARLPKTGLFQIDNVSGIDRSSVLQHGSASFQCVSGDIQNWHQLTDVEIVVPHFWIEERMPIVSFDERTNIVRSSRRSRFVLRDDFAARFASYYVENVAEALTEPGEWYLDRITGQVRYLPVPGEQLDSLEVFAPRIEQLVRLEGDPDVGAYVEHVHFSGVTFEHSEWRQPDGRGSSLSDSGKPQDPTINFASASQGARNVFATVYLHGARQCSIVRCELRHIGGYAVEVADGCSANRIVANRIWDLGAGGVKLGGADAAGPSARRTGDNKVTDNVITAAGRVFHGACGILALHSWGNDLSYNEISDLYYCGISCGYVWGYGENVSRDNRIEYNHIFNLGHKFLNDMGGVYTLGVQPGTVIRGNVIHDVTKRNYGGWGIYLDEGSSHILVERNVCYNTASQGFNQHYGRENIVRNNIFAFGGEGQVSLTRIEDHNSFTLERNILVSAGQPVLVGRRRGQLDVRGFLSDLNVFWDVGGELIAGGAGENNIDAIWTWRQRLPMVAWQALGHDRHSIVVDPGFASVRTFDWTITPESPALRVGFEPWNVGDAGPRSHLEDSRLPS